MIAMESSAQKTMEKPIPQTGLITEAQKNLYQEEGYMILANVIPKDLLQMLREECSYFLGYSDAEMDLKGQKTVGITHRGSRYFISNRYRLSKRMKDFLYSPLMAEVTQACLGPDVFLFHEQWVVKGPEKGMQFAWHQDSGYIKYSENETRHKPYLTCWCTLDDVSVENGTVFLLPHSRGGTKHTFFDHTKEAGTNDLVGYKGTDPGDPVIAPAGSIVAFTSLNFHRSGANTSKSMRRIYLPQYSSEPITNAKGEKWALTVPFVKNGKVVYDPSTDTAAHYGGHAGV